MAVPHVSSPANTAARKLRSPAERFGVDQPTLFDHFKEKPAIARTLKTAKKPTWYVHPALSYVAANLTRSEVAIFLWIFGDKEGRVVSTRPKSPNSEQLVADDHGITLREYKEVLAKLVAFGVARIQELERDSYHIDPVHEGVPNVRWKAPVCRPRTAAEKPEAKPAAEPESVPAKLHCPLKLPCPVTQLVSIAGVLTNKVGPEAVSEPRKVGINIPNPPPPAEPPQAPPTDAEAPESWNKYSNSDDRVNVVKSFIVNELRKRNLSVSVPKPAKIEAEILAPLGPAPLSYLFELALSRRNLPKFQAPNASAMLLGPLALEARANWEADQAFRVPDRPASNGHKPEVPRIDSRQLEYAERILRDPDAGPNERAMAQGLIDAYRAQQEGES